MLNNLSRFLYRLSSLKTALAVTLVYAFFIAVIMPQQSASSALYAGDWGAPDRHFSYSPDALYAAIGSWGEAGRQDYIGFRLGLDIIWALAYTGFLVSWTSCALRFALPANDPRLLLNTWPLITLICDYSENGLGIWLVARHATPMEWVALLASGTTTVKWVSLGLAHLLLLWALGLAARRRLRRRDV